MQIDAMRTKTLIIGRAGESGAAQVLFDCRAWLEEVGGGTFTLLEQRPGDPDAMPVEIETADGIVTWTVTDADTARSGMGEVQLQLIREGVVEKSRIWRTEVRRSLRPGTLEPEPWNYQDRIAAWASEAAASAETASEAATAAGLASEAAETAKTGAETAQAAAETAQAAAESAADTAGAQAAAASESKTAAQTAQTAAESAQESAAAAATAADEAKDAAIAAKTDALAAAEDAAAAQATAEDAAETAATAAGAAADSAADAVTAKNAAQTAAAGASASAESAALDAALAGEAATAAAAAKEAAETAQGLAESAQEAVAINAGAAVEASAAAIHAEEVSENIAETIAGRIDDAEAAAASAQEALTGAQAAQSAAETAQAIAEESKEGAEAAIQYARGIVDEAAAERAGAEAAATAAENWATGDTGGTPTSTNNAKYYSEQAADSAAAAATAKNNAVTAKNDAQTAKTAAETAQSHAESAEAGAVSAKTAAETAQTAAETAGTAAGLSATAAGSAKTAAQTAQAAAEGARDAAAQSAADAEDAKDAAIAAKDNAALSAAAAAMSAQSAAHDMTDAHSSMMQANTFKTNAARWATGSSEGTPSDTNNAMYYSEQAAAQRQAAEDAAETAGMWATGGTSGTPSTGNNAKAYAAAAAAAADEAEEWAHGDGPSQQASHSAAYYAYRTEEIAMTAGYSAQLAENAKAAAQTAQAAAQAAQAAAEATIPVLDVGVDTTLSVPNAAAEAKVTGQLFTEVNDTALWEQGTISSSTGTEGSSTTRLRTISYLPDGITYITCTSEHKYVVLGYTANGTYLGEWDGDAWTTTPTWHTGALVMAELLVSAAKFRIVFANDDNSTIQESEAAFMLWKKAADATLTVPNAAAEAKTTGDRLQTLANALSANGEMMGKIKLIPGKYIYTNGKIRAVSPATDTVRLICVEAVPGKLYAIKKDTATIMRVGCGATDTPGTDEQLIQYSGHASASSDALYVTPTAAKPYIYVQLYAGTDAEELQTPEANLRTLSISSERRSHSVDPVTACIIGASLEAGTTSVSGGGTTVYPEKAYLTVALRNNGVAVTNLSKSGMGYVKKATDNTTFKSILDGTDFAPFDSVYIGVGGNDWNTNQTLGASTDEVGADTVCGMAKYAFETILTSNPAAKIFVMMPRIRKGSFSGYDGDLSTLHGWLARNQAAVPYSLSELHEAVKAVCDLYGIEFISDRWSGIVNAYNIDSVYPDGVHPSVATMAAMAKDMTGRITYK